MTAAARSNLPDRSAAASYVIFILRRGLQVPVLLLFVVVLNFGLIKAAPGDPVALMAPESGASAEYLERIRRELGLDRPPLEQLLTYIGNVVRGDFGISFRYRQPVGDVIASRLPATLLLAGSGLTVSSVLGIFLGVVASRHRGRWPDRALSLFALVGYSIPVFWLGQLLLLLFALYLGWLPAQGIVSVRAPAEGLGLVPDVLSHLVLPLIAYSIFPLTLIMRLTRTKMIEVWSMDFITTARAKGLPDRRITYRHALPNATLPVLGVIGYNVAFLLAGSVLVETVFAWPGMGRLLGDAILARDYPLLLGIFTTTAFMVVVSSFITDAIYGFVDPRVREGGRER